MKKILRQFRLRGFYFLLILCTTIYSGHDELWIDTEALFSIKINMTTGEVIEKLGAPLYLDAQIDQDEQINTIKLYYNFKTKKYNTEKISENDMSWGRKTILQFTFV